MWTDWQPLGLALAGYIIGSIAWAFSQKERIGRLEDRVLNCERANDDNRGGWTELGAKMHRLDLKLTRVMTRLGVPARAEDFDLDGDDRGGGGL